MHTTLYTPLCVSLGPGDPELITLKALRSLQSSDTIFCPKTSVKGRLLSRSLDILRALEIEESRIILFDVPMSKDRTAAESAYLAVAAEIAQQHRQGRRVAFVAEGDAGFYSSAHYVADYLAGQGISIGYLPGVPAFIACGAHAGLHVVKQDEILTVCPQDLTLDYLQQVMQRRGTLVLMKLSLQEEVVKEAIVHLPELSFHYFENIGYEEKEYYTSDKATILSRSFPYFSIMIVQCS